MFLSFCLSNYIADNFSAEIRMLYYAQTNKRTFEISTIIIHHKTLKGVKNCFVQCTISPCSECFLTLNLSSIRKIKHMDSCFLYKGGFWN